VTETLHVLRELVLLAGLSLLVSLVFGRLKLPAVSGFILTGALIGPGGFRLIQDPGTIHLLAEIGVVVLLFTIGLEFSLADLRALGIRTAVAGALQVALTALLIGPALAAAGLHPAQALFLGCAAAISSTTLLLRVVTDRGELRAPHGRLLMGVSLVQDLSIVPLTLLVPVLAGWLHGGSGTTTPPGDMVLHALFGTAAAALVVYAAWKGLPWLMGRASRTGSREVFLAAIVAVVLGSAYLSERIGLSLALGAFLAGLMLAGSETSSQVAADLLPFRDTLSSVFFLSSGMLFSPGAVARGSGSRMWASSRSCSCRPAPRPGSCPATGLRCSPPRRSARCSSARCSRARRRAGRPGGTRAAARAPPPSRPSSRPSPSATRGRTTS